MAGLLDWIALGEHYVHTVLVCIDASPLMTINWDKTCRIAPWVNFTATKQQDRSGNFFQLGVEWTLRLLYVCVEGNLTLLLIPEAFADPFFPTLQSVVVLQKNSLQRSPPCRYSFFGIRSCCCLLEEIRPIATLPGDQRQRNWMKAS